VGLLLPAGYWASASRRRPATTRSGGTRRGPLGGVAYIAALTSLIVGLVIAPRVFHVAMGAWWEWAAGLVALALGAVLHRVLSASAPVEVIDSSIARLDRAS